MKNIIASNNIGYYLYVIKVIHGIKMDTLTLKIPDSLKEKLKSCSKKLGMSKSDIVREALVEYLEKDKMKKYGSFYDLAEDIAGSVQSEPDLSSNKKHLDGYGE